MINLNELHKEEAMIIFKRIGSKKTMRKKLILTLGFLVSINSGSCIGEAKGQGWYTQPQKGWIWYKKQPIPKIKEKKKPEEEGAVIPSSPKKESDIPKVISYTEQMKEVQKQFEELQNKAILVPTLENVQNFQRAQTIMMDHSENFGKMWMLATLVSHQNYRESDQPFPMHRKIYREKREEELDKKIRGMSENYGIFFIFKKDCPYCHEFSPIVRNFIDTYGFEYKAISADGEILPEFPDTVADNGAIRILNPDGIYPILFLVNPNSNQVIPLSRGLVNLTQLKSNCEVIIQTLGDQL